MQTFTLTWETKQSGLIENHWTKNKQTFINLTAAITMKLLLEHQTTSVRNINLKS